MPDDQTKLGQALEALDVRQIESVTEEVLKRIDFALGVTDDVVTAAMDDMLHMLRTAMGQLEYRGRTIDLTAPENVEILSALRNELDGRAGEFSEHLGEAVGKGMSQVITTGSELWTAAEKPRLIALATIEDRLARMESVSNDIAAQVFGSFRSALMVGDKTRSELEDEVGAMLDVGAGRAQQIVHDTMFAGYRQASLAAGNDAESDLYLMTGPVDDRMTQICYDNIGKIRTKDEWRAIHEEVFEEGLHPNCRHQFNPVSQREGERYANEMGEDERLIWSDSDRNFIDTVTQDYGGSMKDYFRAEGGEGADREGRSLRARS